MIKKLLLFLSIYLLCAGSIVANDEITFTWKGNGSSSRTIKISATKDKSFTINWGDTSSPQLLTGTGKLEEINSPVVLDGEFTVTISAFSSDCHLLGLDICNCQVTSVQTSKSPGLEYLNCHNNSLTSLDFSSNPALTVLGCAKNQLRSLNLSFNTMLIAFDGSGQMITDPFTVVSNGYLNAAPAKWGGSDLTSGDYSNFSKGGRFNNNQLEWQGLDGTTTEVSCDFSVSHSSGGVFNGKITIPYVLPADITRPLSDYNTCADSHRLSITARGTGLSYKWYLNNRLIPGAADSYYTATQPGDYKVVVSGVLNSESSSCTINLDVQPRIITQPNDYSGDAESALLSVQVEGNGLAYQWAKGYYRIEGATESSYTAVESGSYSVTAYNDCGTVVSRTAIVELASPVGNELINDTEILIYPNPVKDILYLDTKGESIQRISLYDLSGVLISRFDYPGDNYVSVSNLSKGVYILNLRTDKREVVRKIIKQ